MWGFRFYQDHNAYRAKTWTPLDSDVRWVSSSDKVEVALFERPKVHVEFYVKAFVGPLAAAFDPYLKFSNDGVAVQLGQFNVEPLLTSDYQNLKKGIYSNLKIKFKATVTGEIENRKVIVVEGQERTLPLDVSDVFSGGHDAYIYFGSGRLGVIHGSTALVDRAMPRWLKRQIQSDIGAAIQFYEKVLGPRPPLKINFLITWEPDADLSIIPKANIGGSVMEGPGVRTIDLVVMKKHIRQNDKELVRSLQVVIFHELAHFWNRTETNDFRPVGWMVEGGADAITYRALRDLRRISRVEYDQILKDKIKYCRENYKVPIVLADLKPNDDYYLAYTCGLFVSVLTEGQWKDGDYFSFLRALFAAKDRQGGKYTLEDYFGLLKEKGRHGHQIESLRKWIEAPGEDRTALFNHASGVPNSP